MEEEYSKIPFSWGFWTAWIIFVPWVAPLTVYLSSNGKYSLLTLAPIIYVFIHLYINTLFMPRNPGGENEESIRLLLKRSHDLNVIGFFFLTFFEIFTITLATGSSSPEDILALIWTVIIVCYILYLFFSLQGDKRRHKALYLISISPQSKKTSIMIASVYFKFILRQESCSTNNSTKSF